MLDRDGEGFGLGSGRMGSRKRRGRGRQQRVGSERNAVSTSGQRLIGGRRNLSQSLDNRIVEIFGEQKLLQAV